jgi:hypothetical protein
MHKLFGGRHQPSYVNKPLPEPLVDPDEGKTPIGKDIVHQAQQQQPLSSPGLQLILNCSDILQVNWSLFLFKDAIFPTENASANRTHLFSSNWAMSPRGQQPMYGGDRGHVGKRIR